MHYRIADNSIQATAFKAVKAPFQAGERPENDTDKGLRIADKGYLNTAVMRSEITYIDGEAGSESVPNSAPERKDADTSSPSHGVVLRYRCATTICVLG